MLRGNSKRSRLFGIVFIFASSLILAGCIRPVDPNATPESGATDTGVILSATTTGPVVNPTATNTPPPTIDAGGNQNIAYFNAVNQHYAVEANFNLNARPETFEVWQVEERATGTLIGFNYLNNSGLPCMGVAVYTIDAFGNPAVYTAGFQCSTDLTNSSPGIAGQWLLVLANGTPVQALAVRINNAPNAAFLALNNTNGTVDQVSLNSNGVNYMSIRDFGNTVTTVNVLDGGGNFISQIIVIDNPQG